MKKILERKVANENMTRQVIEKIFREYLQPVPNFSLFLEGGLGAGKTFCAREILRLAGTTEAITSPTYTYVQTYEPAESGYAHFDLYRIRNSAEFFEKGLEDIATDEQVQKLVEWPIRMGEDLSIFSGVHYTLKIDHGIGASMRTILLLQ